MTRKFKTLGLALVAVFAMSAIVAQAASAQTHTFKSDSGSGNTVLTGANTNTHEFSISGSLPVICDNATFEGTVAGNEVGTITVRPEYFNDTGDCDAAGNEAAVITNDCAYVFHNETTDGHATVDIECAEGNRIEIELTGLGTTLTVPAQTGLSGVNYSNIANHEGTGKEAVGVDATVSEIDTSCEGVFCFLFTTGPNTGNYEGEATVTGYRDEGSAEGNPTTPDYDDNEGSLVNVTVE